MDNNNYKQDYITAKESYLTRKGCLTSKSYRILQSTLKISTLITLQWRKQLNSASRGFYTELT